MAIFERVEKFDFSNVRFTKINAFSDYTQGFVIKLQLKEFPKSKKRELLVSCPYFSIFGVRLHAQKDKDDFSEFEKRDKAWIYADESGFVYALELKASFLSPYQATARETVLDLLLNMFDAKAQEVYAYYDGVKLGWVYANEERNCDFPFGTLVKDEAVQPFVKRDVACLFANDVSAVKKQVVTQKTDKSINFYSPKAYNAWAGDAMNFYHDGVYHLLYLHDRHHHGSRWGGGAHSVCHLTTTDFKDWIEQPPIVEIDESWKTAGTGTMFYHKGNYYFSHGFHTSRMVPDERTGSCLMREQNESKERIIPVSYTTLQENGLYPSGANYLVSKDGIRFETGHCMFHISENPSVYVDDRGDLFMFGGYGSSGVWRAQAIDGEWTLDNSTQVPQSLLEPSTECPSMFELNGYKYLVMGFTGCWKTGKGGDIYHDEAIQGFDVYDGLSVPMVVKTSDGRLILCGWVGNDGWASVLVHRELIQDRNGRLFMKWVKELAPNVNDLKLLARNKEHVSLNERESYYFEMDVHAKADTQVFVKFIGNQETVLALDSKRKVIQINDSEEPILPLYELVKQGKGNKNSTNIHTSGKNFAIGQADTIEKPYKLKIQLYYEKKSDSVFIDCEIGEKRTIISNRLTQRYSKVYFQSSDGSIDNINAYVL